MICLAAGVVGPRLGAFANPSTLALVFRLLLLLSALVFGFLGRRTRSGLVGLIGSAVLLTVLLVTTVVLVSRPPVREIPAAVPSVPSK